MVPRLAVSKYPLRLASAPVNAPLTCPNRVDSSRSGGSEPELTPTKRLFGPRRVGVNRLRDQFLAGAGFARDQNVGAAGATWDTRSSTRSIRSLLPTMFGKRVALLQCAPQFACSRAPAACARSALDLDQQLFVVPGLGEVVVGAGFQRLHRDFNGPICRDQEDGGLRVALADVVQHFQTGAVRHHEIQQNQVVDAGLELLQALGGVLGAGRRRTLPGRAAFPGFRGYRLHHR